MRYFIVAGEASGDLHGAELIKSIKQQSNTAQFCFTGGDLMAQAANCKPLIHYKQMAFMGVFNVLFKLITLLNNFKRVKQAILKAQPNVLILIDYPGFNLPIAKWAYLRGIKVVYYIPPKVWAWKKWRIKQLKRYTHKLLVIFPFEQTFFQQHNCPVQYIGNPLVQVVQQAQEQGLNYNDFVQKHNLTPNKPIVVIFAGSRAQEVKMLLPIMAVQQQYFTDYQFIIAGISSIDAAVYSNIQAQLQTNLPVIFDNNYALLQLATAAIVKSGTVTLETALFKVPQVVVYKLLGGKILSILFKKIFLKVPFVSLVNLIANKQVCVELLQHFATAHNIKNELEKLLLNQPYRTQMLHNYRLIAAELGSANASQTAASIIMQLGT